MAPGLRLPRGALAAVIAARRESARRQGALRAIPTREHVVLENGLAFVVRTIAQERRRAAARRPVRGNPFLPYEEALFVADVSDTHVCLLNKFPVVDGHLLLVTRAFEDQLAPLCASDFTALAACLRETDGLGFYNAGEAAGASERHKHLQLVPLPLGPGPTFPLEARLAERAEEGRVVASADLPFPVALARIEALAERDPEDAAPALEGLYREMLERTGVRAGRAPYNLLATRRLLWLAPRSRGEWQGIPVNALGFAGALLVPDDATLARLRAVGPLAVLRAVTGPAAARV